MLTVLSVTIQTLGPGDAVETVFGPLTTVPTGTSYQASDHNIIVLVENVMQIGESTNFDVEQSVSGSLTGPNAPYADGWYIKFTSAVDLGKDVTVYFGYAN